MEQHMLRNSIEVLKKLRLNIHNNLEIQEREMLDDVISELEIALRTNRNIKADKILKAFGKIIEKIPTVVELIKLLLGK